MPDATTRPMEEAPRRVFGMQEKRRVECWFNQTAHLVFVVSDPRTKNSGQFLRGCQSDGPSNDRGEITAWRQRYAANSRWRFPLTEARGLRVCPSRS
eukprot:2227034-Amphidinium_carterae.2